MATAKTSVTLDEKLLTKVRKRVGRRGLSSFVNQAVLAQLQREMLLDYLKAAEAERPPTRAERKAAEAELARILGGAKD